MAKLVAKSSFESASFPARCLLQLIAFYRYAISPLLPARCRFYPTCSAYAVEAIQKHGALKGGSLTVKRLCKCHPWGEHGVDMVPDPDPQDSSSNCCQRKP
ncbi:membrane protein insertion efficiency factor YidD [Oceanobacter mangrovi]|uniref:membrane protein insertion efficiency factor YidD n=1 Tax=Oceanobacter mangrovi TaxID=2862510 RepID=UPI001C8DE434|nr:membrane protein insertion efficiency factor YidD [Oceanobacter mangrovi]